MSESPVVFGNSYEALVRVLKPVLDVPLRDAFKAMGVDLERPLPAYPYPVWVKSLELAMDARWPNQTRDEQSYLMGRAIFESYADSILGSALLQMLKVLGPKRALERMTRNLRTTNNYSETTLKQLAERTYELWINKVAFPHYFRGVLEAGLVAGGAKSPTVIIASVTPGAGATFRVAWT